jgi:hypothetical protein
MPALSASVGSWPTRRSIEARDDGGRGFAVRWARERLAVLDGDGEAIVALLGGDLSSPHQFIRVCEAMAELGRDDEVLLWAGRARQRRDGWLAGRSALWPGVRCAGAALGSTGGLRLRREQHGRIASASTYSLLRRAADAVDAWDIQREAARLELRERDLGGLADALLYEGDVEGAWNVAHEDPDWDPGLPRRLCLAEAREALHPEQALPWYTLVADEMLLETGRRSYARPSRYSSTPAAPPTRPVRASGSQPGSRSFANVTAAVRRLSRCSTRPASTDAPTETTHPPGTLATTQKRLRERHSGQADARSRTGDLLLTMQVLYQLSYVGASNES